jgi:hypothetical protein
LEKFELTAKQPTGRMKKIFPSESTGIETDSIKKGGSQGI